MIEITDDIYRRIAARLRKEIAAAEWFNGSIAGEETFTAHGSTADVAGKTPESPVEWRLTLTAIIYRRTEILPEGVRRPIDDVVPVWWEFSTVGEGGAISNDFSFNKLKPCLIDYD